jgi:RimJ/RimL family protein N-acetyltransferase
MPVPLELRTARLVLRPWRAEDAAALRPILETNNAHLGPWIPVRVSTPAPVPELEKRLAGFAADFAASREWRYGIFTPEGEILGEAGLYPRTEATRVAYHDADRVELGYWLREDMTGRGLVTEAARALLTIAEGLPRVSCVEIRCDERNAPSAAVPRRLGFVLADTITDVGILSGEPAVQLQIWRSKSVPGGYDGT